MDTFSGHIVKSYDQELNQMLSLVMKMGEKAGQCLEDAIKALVEKNGSLAQTVIQTDPEIDKLEREVDDLAVKILALRRPVARDLRTVIAALKITSDIERMGDHAANISRRAIELKGEKLPTSVDALARMTQLVVTMLKQALVAYQNSDEEMALHVWHQDREVDNMYAGLLRELLTYMMEDPRHIGACSQMLFIAKNIERSGDHVTNIAETIFYMVTGKSFVPPEQA